MPTLKQRLGLDRDPLYLIDGTSYLYRGFYAYPDLKRSDGLPTGALFIALRILLRILREEKPRYMGFFMDGKGPTFRHEMFEPYKAQRPRMPEPLAAQIEPLRQAVELMGVHLTVSDGVEADDCIASLAAAHKAERPVVIVASDKDLKQCLDEGVVLWDPAGKKETLVTLADFRTEMGIEPAQWPDFQALTGDSADNIPGVPGVGPKTALLMMQDHPTLESLRDGFDELPEKLRKKLDGHLEDIFLYRRLTRLRADCDRTSLADLALRPPRAEALTAFLDDYEFRSLAREALALARAAAPADPKPAPAAAAPAKGKAAKAKPGAAQFFLFGDAPVPAAAADAPPLELTEISDPADLPDMAGRRVGLTPAAALADGLTAPAGLRLGLGGKEYRYTGPAAPLAERLAAAGQAAVPDLHELWRDPALGGGAVWGRVPLAVWFDCALAAYLLDPEERNYGWARLRQSLWQDLPGADVAGLPAGAQGLAALAYADAVTPRLADAGLDRLMRDLEIPLVPVLADMERRGVAVDPAAFQSFLDEVNARIEALTAQIHEQAGTDFNIRSSQQLAQLLFETLGLKPAGKTPGGALSTANTVLEKLSGRHPVVDSVLEFRGLEKLRSTYLDPLPRLVDAGGRIHTHFNRLATATGRLSSSGPNLQNIPIRGPQGPRMRACFTAGPGKLLAAADYSQIELRVLAHFSQDPALLAAFAKGEDIHASTAALIFDKASPADVTTEERRGAKTINFGLIYGMGPQRLARELGVTLNQAKEFIERYFAKLGTLKAFYETVVQGATERGWVGTLAGRRRLLPELASRNQQMQSQARRQAVNTVIQGSAADIIKLAMLAVDRDARLKALDAGLILQVHDELLVEAPAAAAREAGERLRELMQGVVELDVPLVVDLGTGFTWAEAH
ncbi:MAG: DNA polymerase I [Desulfovibrionaceae bacterium]